MGHSDFKFQIVALSLLCAMNLVWLSFVDDLFIPLPKYFPETLVVTVHSLAMPSMDGYNFSHFSIQFLCLFLVSVNNYEAASWCLYYQLSTCLHFIFVRTTTFKIDLSLRSACDLNAVHILNIYIILFM